MRKGRGSLGRASGYGVFWRDSQGKRVRERKGRRERFFREKKKNRERGSLACDSRGVSGSRELGERASNIFPGSKFSTVFLLLCFFLSLYYY